MKRESFLSLEELQRATLDVLVSFADYCARHDLRYCLAYGTLLGAVRHGGFVPWDDDIDVFLPRSDYERLLGAPLDNERFGTAIPSGHVGPWPFVKIYSKEVAFCELGTKHSSDMGAFVDVFPVDSVTYEHAARKYKELKKWRRLHTYA